MLRWNYLLLVLTVMLGTPTSSQDASSSRQGSFELIPAETVEELRDLPVSGVSDLSYFETFDAALPYTYRSGDVPDEFFAIMGAPSIGQISLPQYASNSMIIELSPDATFDEVLEFTERRQLEITKSIPEIATIVVNFPLANFVFTQQEGNFNERLERGVQDAVSSLEEENVVHRAIPDFILVPQEGNMFLADKVLSTTGNRTIISTETSDWGISDINADTLWSEPEAHDAVILAIIDIGFSRHEDLSFLLDSRTDNHLKPHDHGNHVAGIACAGHNSKGVLGVLPRCSIRPFVPNETFDINSRTISGDVEYGAFFIFFSEILENFRDILDDGNSIRAINASLGYNAIPNFWLNPDLAGDEQVRWQSRVAQHGAGLGRTLARLSEKGVVVFSAAGNDSQYFPNDPIDAKYASPFNWAAVEAQSKGIFSAYVVEAHERKGEKAPFSNEGGHISCPGSDILSSVSFGPDKRISPSYYAEKSGTSMASPYCAAGFVLLSLVRPNYRADELMKCILASSDLSSSGTPMMRLKQAADLCPRK